MKSTRAQQPLASWARRLALELPWGWALVALLLFGWYAQFITHISWNAIELIIAQNLLEHGVFATSLDYPSAVTWRPVVPTLMVTLFRLVTDDPLTIYRIVCGVAIASLTACLFLVAKRLAGGFAAHVAAALTLTCPAVTTYLVNHAHSYSHWGAMLTLGPAIVVTMRLLLPRPDETNRTGWYVLGGACWGLAYLSRSELLLFAGLSFLALLWTEWRSKRRWRSLAAWLLPFVLMFSAYNVHASAAAAKDGILIRKTIYTFYVSQGWVDPPPWSSADLEGDGYRYATQLYGDPLRNKESLIRALSRNPSAVQRRVIRNFVGFYRAYGYPWFFSTTWALAAGIMLVVVICRGIPDTHRIPLLLLAGYFAAAHFVLLLHIDHRYLTITVPTLLLLAAALTAWLIARSERFGRLPGRMAEALVVVGILATALPQVNVLRHHRERDDRGVTAMRAFGTHFRQYVSKPRLAQNRQPHIHFEFPTDNPLRPEERFLLAYFTRTSWVNGGAEGTFPRGRFYSYHDREPDYFYWPDARLDELKGAPGRVVARHENPVLGAYTLYSAR